MKNIVLARHFAQVADRYIQRAQDYREAAEANNIMHKPGQKEYWKNLIDKATAFAFIAEDFSGDGRFEKER